MMTSYKHIHNAMNIARVNWKQSKEAAKTAHKRGMYKAWSHWMRKAKMHKRAYTTLALALHWTMYIESRTTVKPMRARDFNARQIILLVDYYYPSIIRQQAM